MEINISLHERKYFFTRRKFGTDARKACREQVPTTVSGYVKADGQATGKTAGKGRQGGLSCDLSVFILPFIRFALPLQFKETYNE